jgi:molybdopterin molybdotransferase
MLSLSSFASGNSGMIESRVAIEDFIEVLSAVPVLVEDARGRILAEDILAPVNVPAFDESLRDGYVVFEESEAGDTMGYTLISGEIAAGTTEIPVLEPGQCCRIFTGGVIPVGATRVYPHEVCRLEGARLYPEKNRSSLPRRFIRKKSSEICAGEPIAAKGSEICGDLLAILTELGRIEVFVHRQVRTGYYCTGSELVEAGTTLKKGQKNSINGLVLGDRLPGFGGEIVQKGVLTDDEAPLMEMFSSIRSFNLDLVVTTGGMGPGKYDLVRSSFLRAGGSILFDALPMRPGKSILVGKIAGTVFIALPGPPPAVRTLINELVGPVMLLMQGANNSWPQVVHAELLHDMRVRKRDLLQFKSGVVVFEQGKLFVRLAERLEPSTCFLALWPDNQKLAKGDLVEIHISR